MQNANPSIPQGLIDMIDDLIRMKYVIPTRGAGYRLLNRCQTKSKGQHFPHAVKFSIGTKGQSKSVPLDTILWMADHYNDHSALPSRTHSENHWPILTSRPCGYKVCTDVALQFAKQNS